MNNDGADNSDEAEEVGQQPNSSFYSQMPYLSQQMLAGADGSEGEQRLELFQMTTLLHNEKMAPELLPF